MDLGGLLGGFNAENSGDSSETGSSLGTRQSHEDTDYGSSANGFGSDDADGHSEELDSENTDDSSWEHLPHTAPADVSAVRTAVLEAVQVAVGESVDAELPLTESGLDSISAVELGDAISAQLGVQLPATAMFDYPTVDLLTEWIVKEMRSHGHTDEGGSDATEEQGGAMQHSLVRAEVMEALQLVAGLTVDGGEPLTEAGLDSISSVELQEDIAARLGIELPATTLYDYPTVDLLVEHICQRGTGTHTDEDCGDDDDDDYSVMSCGASGHMLSPDLVREEVMEALQLVAGLTVDGSEPLTEAGLDSISSVELQEDIAARLGIELPATTLYDYPTVDLLVEHICQWGTGTHTDEDCGDDDDDDYSGLSCGASGHMLSPDLVREEVMEALQLVAGLTVDRGEPLTEAGLDSINSVELQEDIAARLGIELPATTLYDYPTVDLLVEHICQRGTETHTDEGSCETSRAAGMRMLSPDLVREEVMEALQLVAGLTVDGGEPLTEAGLDSISSVELQEDIAARLGIELPATTLYDYPTVDLLVEHICQRGTETHTDEGSCETSRAAGMRMLSPDLVREEVMEALQLVAGLTVDGGEPLTEAGLDSINSVELQEDIAARLGIELSATTLYDYPTVDLLVEHICGCTDSNDYNGLMTTTPTLSKPAAHIQKRKPAKSLPKARVQRPRGQQVYLSIVSKLAEPLPSRVSAVRPIPLSRWDVEGQKASRTSGVHLPRLGAFIDAVESFDSKVFNLSTGEADLMDPQQRLLLEGTVELLLGAMSTTTGWAIFIGIQAMEYGHIATDDPDGMSPYTATSGNLSVAAGRIAYTFGFTGPAVAVDTACSAALVAAHLAANSLAETDKENSLAGGVNLTLSPRAYAATATAGMLSPDSHCKTLDACADGYGRSEAVSMVWLHRGDGHDNSVPSSIVMLVGTSMNQDGRSSSLTAPNGPSQQEVILGALQSAFATREMVHSVEMHGTGTPLGDPIEIGAIRNVYGIRKSKVINLYAAKSMRGHAEAAAGSVGFSHGAEMVSGLTTDAIVGLGQINPFVSSNLGESSDTKVPRQSSPSPGFLSSHQHLMGLSSFAFMGTNAHAIMCKAKEMMFGRLRMGKQAVHWDNKRHWVDAIPPHGLVKRFLTSWQQVQPPATSLVVVFQGRMDQPSMAHMSDHVVNGHPILPGAAMYESMLASSAMMSATQGGMASWNANNISSSCRVSNIAIIAAIKLQLANVSGSALHIIMDALDGSIRMSMGHRMDGLSQTKGSSTNAVGYICSVQLRRASTDQPITSSQLPVSILTLPNHYGNFMGSPQRALAKVVERPCSLVHQHTDNRYICHPAVVDATTHTIIVARQEMGPLSMDWEVGQKPPIGETYMPVGIGAFSFTPTNKNDHPPNHRFSKINGIGRSHHTTPRSPTWAACITTSSRYSMSPSFRMYKMNCDGDIKEMVLKKVLGARNSGRNATTSTGTIDSRSSHLYIAQWQSVGNHQTCEFRPGRIHNQLYGCVLLRFGRNEDFTLQSHISSKMSTYSRSCVPHGRVPRIEWGIGATQAIIAANTNLKERALIALEFPSTQASGISSFCNGQIRDCTTQEMETIGLGLHGIAKVISQESPNSTNWEIAALGCNNANYRLGSGKVKNPTRIMSDNVHVVQEEGNVIAGRKLLQQYSNQSSSSSCVRCIGASTSTYEVLVTGGLGGLGMLVGAWAMASKTSGRLRLLGRKGRSAYQVGNSLLTHMFQELSRKNGDTPFNTIKILVECQSSDLGASEDMMFQAKTFQHNEVYHSSGVLKDSLIQKQTPATLREVASPKLCGAYLVDAYAGISHPCQAIVAFSSVASFFGSIGQTNYSATNSMLDVWTHHSNQRGSPSRSVQWGAWSKVGMAVDTPMVLKRVRDSGLGVVKPVDGLLALGTVLRNIRYVATNHELWRDNATLTSPLDIQLLKRATTSNVRPLLDDFPATHDPTIISRTSTFSNRTTTTSDSWSSTSTSAANIPTSTIVYYGENAAMVGENGGQQRAMSKTVAPSLLSEVKRLVGEAVSSVVGVDVVDGQQPLSTVGVDSLSAMEIQTNLGKIVGLNLPATTIYDYPNIDSLAAYITNLDRAGTLASTSEIQWAPESEMIRSTIGKSQTAYFQAEDAPASQHHANKESIRNQILEALVAVVGENDNLSDEQSFSNLGVDSLGSVELRNSIVSATGIELSPTILYDYPTVSTLTTHLAQIMLDKESKSGDSSHDRRRSVGELADLSPQLQMSHPRQHVQSIAPPSRFSIGMNMVSRVAESYGNCHEQSLKDVICRIPDDRWDVEAQTPLQLHSTPRFGGFLNGIELFDCHAFGMSVPEADIVDPQQRVILEATYTVLHVYGRGNGQPANAFEGLRTSSEGNEWPVVVAIQNMEYGALALVHNSQIGPYTATSGNLSVAAGRLSFTFGFVGASISIDTACSSTLVAAHVASSELGTIVSSTQSRSNALAAGVGLTISPFGYDATRAAGMLCNDGRCKTLDASADGYGRSEAYSVIWLNAAPQVEIRSDSHQNTHNSTARRACQALLLGTCVNQDGRSSSLTAPHGPSQQVAITRAMDRAGKSPIDICGIEAHGTGTPLGDPIEMGAIGDVFSQRKRPQMNDTPILNIVAAKSKQGHAEPAAASVGFTFVFEEVCTQAMSPMVGLGNVNPHVARVFESSGDALNEYVPRQYAPVQMRRHASPLTKGLSSFAYMGTNAHGLISKGNDHESRENKHIVSLFDKSMPWQHRRHWYTYVPHHHFLTFFSKTSSKHDHMPMLMNDGVSGTGGLHMRGKLCNPKLVDLICDYLVEKRTVLPRFFTYEALIAGISTVQYSHNHDAARSSIVHDLCVAQEVIIERHRLIECEVEVYIDMKGGLSSVIVAPVSADRANGSPTAFHDYSQRQFKHVDAVAGKVLHAGGGSANKGVGSIASRSLIGGPIDMHGKQPLVIIDMARQLELKSEGATMAHSVGRVVPISHVLKGNYPESSDTFGLQGHIVETSIYAMRIAEKLLRGAIDDEEKVQLTPPLAECMCMDHPSSGKTGLKVGVSTEWVYSGLREATKTVKGHRCSVTTGCMTDDNVTFMYSLVPCIPIHATLKSIGKSDHALAIPNSDLHDLQQYPQSSVLPTVSPKMVSRLKYKHLLYNIDWMCSTPGPSPVDQVGSNGLVHSLRSSLQSEPACLSFRARTTNVLHAAQGTRSAAFSPRLDKSLALLQSVQASMLPDSSNETFRRVGFRSRHPNVAKGGGLDIGYDIPSSFCAGATHSLIRTFALEEPSSLWDVIHISKTSGRQHEYVGATSNSMSNDAFGCLQRDGVVLQPNVLTSTVIKKQHHGSFSHYPTTSRYEGLVTGGLGGLGWLVSRWVTSRNGDSHSHLLLLGRSGRGTFTFVSDDNSNACVEATMCDLASSDDMCNTIGRKSNIELFHSGGVSTTALLPKQSIKHLKSVLPPKLKGTLLASHESSSWPMLSCVMFSSISAFMGGGSQSMYGSANAILDVWAETSKHMGFVAASVQWGAWEGTGMAAGHSRVLDWQLKTGLGVMSPSKGLHALGTIANEMKLLH